MEENYIFEKEYSISPEIFEKSYLAFQKKYVYPKSRIFALIFLFLTADFVYAVLKDPTNYFTYILVFTCLAFAVREMVNPARIRNQYVDTVEEMGEIVYKIGLGRNYVDIATVSAPEILRDPQESYEETDGQENSENDDMPDASRIMTDNNFNLFEYNEFFLMFYGKEIFYIVPKEGFSEQETELIRNLKK